MKLNYELTGIAKVKEALGYMIEKIKDSIFVAQQETGMIGEEFAKNTAPYLTGEIAKHIYNNQVNQFTWEIVSVSPPSDGNIPINELFDTGDYTVVFPKYVIKNPDSLFFMQKTAAFVEDEYSRRLNFIIESNLK